MPVRVSADIKADHEALRRLVTQAFDGVGLEAVEVHVRPARTPAQSFTGRAYWRPPSRPRLAPGTRWLVVLRVPRHLRNRAYPQTYRYPRRQTAPSITVRDWRERLVALAAHEACHVWQFREGLRRSEVQAERWALRILEQWRGSGAVAARARTGWGSAQLRLFPI